MKRTKKLLSLFMVFVMLLTLIPNNYVMASEIEDEQVTTETVENDKKEETVNEASTEQETTEKVEEVTTEDISEEKKEVETASTTEEVKASDATTTGVSQTSTEATTEITTEVVTTETTTEDASENKKDSSSKKEKKEKKKEDEKDDKQKITVVPNGASYSVDGIMAYAYNSSLSGEYYLKVMDNGTLAKALYYSYGSLGYSKYYEEVDKAYIENGATCDVDKIIQSKDILSRLYTGLIDSNTRTFLSVIGALPSYDSSVFNAFYIVNEEDDIVGFTSKSAQSYSTPNNTITIEQDTESTEKPDKNKEESMRISLMSSGGTFNAGYPSMSEFTKVNGKDYGFPTDIDDIPQSWLNLEKKASSEKHLYDATFTYTDLDDYVDSRATFAGATCKVKSCSSNKDLNGKKLSLFHCLTGEEDSPPSALCDSDSSSETYDINGNPITVKLHFNVKYVDQKKHRVYIEFRTDYIAADNNRNYTSVQAVGGGIYYTYDETKIGYVSVNKDGILKYSPSNIDANISNLKLNGTVYTIYESDKKSVLGMFAIANDGQGYVYENNKITASKTLELEANEKYYIKETAASAGYKLDSTGGDGKGFYEFTVSKDNTEAKPLVVNRVNEISPKSFTFRKVSDNTNFTNNNPLYSLKGAKYDLNDNAGNYANFIVGFKTTNNYGSTSQNVKIPVFGNTSTNKFITDENGYLTYTFSYAGAESDISAYYSNYRKSGNSYTITFTGNIYAIIGSYRLSELSAATGYKIDANCNAARNKYHAFTLSEAHSTASITCKEVPFADPLRVNMQKEDAETKKINPIGSASLKGAIFEVDYYNNHYTKNQLSGKNPTRRWYFSTDENGKWSYENSTPLNNGTYKSDAFYINSQTNQRTIPLGTVTVKEIVAPEGYLTTWDPAWKGSIVEGKTQLSDNEMVLYQFKMNEANNLINMYLNGSSLLGSGAITISNIAYDYAKRGDIVFDKLRYDDGEPMKNIAFILESMTTHEKHIIVTDENGKATTSLSKDEVNVYDSYLTDLTNENVVNNQLQPSGVWFYGTADKSKWDSNNIIKSRGALPYDTYTITEIASKNNEGTQLIEYGDFVFVVNAEGMNAVDSVLDTKMPQIKSLSQDNNTKSHFTVAAKASSITDVISYEFCRFDKDYTLKGILVASKDCTSANGVDYKAGQPILDDNGYFIVTGKSFHTGSGANSKTKTLASGDVSLDYTFDSESLKGVHAVWQTFLCEGNDTTPLVVNDGFIDKKGSNVITYVEDGTEKYVEDVDLANENETVRFAAIDTNAITSKAKTNITQVSKETVVKDIARLTCLDEDNKYKLVTSLVNPETGEIVTANDGNPCKTVTGITYKEDSSTNCMEIEVTLPDFDSTTYADKRVVVIQKLYLGDVLIAIDDDLENIEESVYFSDMHTTATDGKNGKMLQPRKEMTIVDTVEYTNLIVGREYSLTGTLYTKDEKGNVVQVVKNDGTPITGKVTFVAEESKGTVDVVFKFNLKDIKGGMPLKTVVFEDMYYNGIKFLTHADIDDESQTVEFPRILIHTTALSEDTQDHIAGAYKTAKIIDTVQYEGLSKKTYRLVGTLMDKSTGKALLVNGEPVISEKIFSPSDIGKNGLCSGTVDVEFSFNAKEIKGKTVVVYEELYTKDLDSNDKETDEWIDITSHKDIEDEGQSVHFVDIHTKATDKNGNKEVKPSKKVTLIDEVSYTNLIVGKTYTLKGMLMIVPESKTGDSKDVEYTVSTEELKYDSKKGTYVDQNGYVCSPLIIDGSPVTSEVTFVCKKTDGTVDMKFTFDARKLGKKKVCIFEDMYTDGIRIGTHADITDSNQTITFKDNKTGLSISVNNTYKGHGLAKTGDLIHLFAIIATLLSSLFLAVLLFMAGHKKEIKALCYYKKKQYIRIKKNLVLVFLFSVGVLGASSLVKASDNIEYETKEDSVYASKQYETKDKDEKYSFDETYEGKELVDTKYEIVETTYQKKTQKQTKEFSKLKEKSEGSIDKTITIDGVEYKLTNITWKEEPITEKVNYTIDYGYCTSEPKPESTYTYKYTSPSTKQEATVTLPFVRLDKGEVSWVDGFEATLTFKNIEGEEFNFGNHTVIYKENLDLNESDYQYLISMLGYDNSLYRFNSFRWSGDAYEGAEDQLWRNAIVSGQQYATKYSAFYEDEVETGKLYFANAEYEGEVIDKSSEPTYLIKATAIYKEKEEDSFLSKKTILVLSLILLLVFIVIAYLILYKRNRRTKTVEAVDENKKEKKAANTFVEKSDVFK